MYRSRNDASTTAHPSASRRGGDSTSFEAKLRDMAKPRKEEKPENTEEGERIPFDDALRRILAAPPNHKVAKKKPATEGKKKAR